MRLTRKTLYALEAVIDIAHHAGPDPVQSKDITARQNIPQRYLESVLQHLVRAGILSGVRGPKGGYRLARERQQIGVGEIVRLIADQDGGADLPCGDAGSALGRAVVYPVLTEAREDMFVKLDGVSVEDLCRRATEQGLSQASSEIPELAVRTTEAINEGEDDNERRGARAI
jgi:Rrf2 family iron-sulfur cluster assembly transcriptional regulator